MAPRTGLSAAAAQSIVLVTNAGDEAATATYLATLGGPQHHRTVVRSTPGERDVAVLAADVLVALGKNPQILRTERVGSEVWNLARAWTIGLGIRDLIVDRVHLLTIEQTAALIELAAGHANLWFVYGGTTANDVAAHLALVDHPVDQLPWWQLAACHRHLHRRDFDRIADVFYPAAQRADTWADAQHASSPATLTTRLTGWLRDQQLADAPTPAEAVITLRATQATLFVRGLLLRWSTAALGPNPARRLPGDLTAHRAAALGAITRTDHTAAAALSLHLNLGPNGFGCWRCGDVSTDGATIDPPRKHGQHLYQYQRPNDAELPCDGAITVPVPARPIIAAHLAYRRGAGARNHDPFFQHPTDHAKPAHHTLRTGIAGANQRLNLNPPWMHPDPCRYGADVGVTPRSPGWLTERGLSLHPIDAPFQLRPPAPRRPRIRDIR